MDKLRQLRIALLIILGSATVLVLVLRAGIRTESKKWYGVLFAADYFPPLNGFPNALDADECNLICKKLGDLYPFKMSRLHPDHKAFYGLPGSRYTVVSTYGIMDVEEQQKVVHAARNIRREGSTRPFVIEFYALETGPSPRDQFLRKVRID